MIEWQSPEIYVNGRFMRAEQQKQRPIVSPYLSKVIGEIPECGQSEVNAAILAARTAFDREWKRTAGGERARLLFSLADLLDARAAEIGELETWDNGKTLKENEGQARFSARIYRYYAGLADKLQGDAIPLDRQNFLDYTRLEPLGVAALITSWNSPMQLLANKLAPALAAGCTAVIKPSEEASLSTLYFAKLIDEAGFPAGVVNIVSGGPECGAALTSADQIDIISFTGSVPTGRAIAKSAAENNIPTVLELGGKSPNIVFESANLDDAAEGAIAGIFAAAGQTCIAGSRLLVQGSIREAFVSKLVERTESLYFGDPMDPRTDVGPMANKAQFLRVNEILSRAKQNEEYVEPTVQSSGESELLIKPVIFSNAKNSSEIAATEIFGPVLTVIEFSDEKDAIEKANDSKFGLASGIWTNDLGQAHRVASELEAGTVWINTYRVSEPQAPFGGTKQSGHGRERGIVAVSEYLQTKNVMVNLGKAK